MKLLNSITLALPGETEEGLRFAASAAVLLSSFNPKISLCIVENLKVSEKSSPSSHGLSENYFSEVYSLFEKQGYSKIYRKERKLSSAEDLLREALKNSANGILLPNMGGGTALTMIREVLSYSCLPVIALKLVKRAIPETVIAAYDASTPALFALQSAAHLARAYTAKLLVVTVGASGPKEAEIDLAKNERAIDIDFSGLSVDWLSLTGSPTKAIVAQVQQSSEPIVCLGTVGRGYLGRLIMGSVTEAVLTRCQAHVLICKAASLFEASVEQDLSWSKKLQEASLLLLSGCPREAINLLEPSMSESRESHIALSCLAEAHERLGNQARARLLRQEAAELLHAAWEYEVNASAVGKRVQFSRAVRKSLK